MKGERKNGVYAGRTLEWGVGRSTLRADMMVRSTIRVVSAAVLCLPAS